MCLISWPRGGMATVYWLVDDWGASLTLRYCLLYCSIAFITLVGAGNMFISLSTVETSSEQLQCHLITNIPNRICSYSFILNYFHQSLCLWVESNVRDLGSLNTCIDIRLQAFWQSALSRRFPHTGPVHTHKKAFLHMSVSFSQAFVFQKWKKHLALSPARRTLAGFLMNNTSTGRNRHIVPAGVHWKKHLFGTL